MIRAARLDSDLYEEVEADRNATNDALLAVVIVAVASGIGSAISSAQNGSSGGAVGGLLFGIVWGILGWVIWSYLTYFIGTRLFKGTATPGELLRTIGFAQSPGVLNVLSFIPGIGGLLSFVAGIWMLIAGVIAVRQALDFDTGKAVITTILGWLVLAVPIMLVAAGGAALFAMLGLASS
jgi:hypothetical protein